MIYVFLADGFEETEALTPLDILRRGKRDVKTVGILGKYVTGSHGITVQADITENEAVTDNLEAIILPGGMPGTLNLEKNKTVSYFIDYAAKQGLLIAAICAAPSILGHKGLLKGRKATCFNGYESELTGAIITDKPAVQDGNIITGWGAGGSFHFGFKILAALTGDDESVKHLAESMRYPESL